jgi:hypothetical protein
MLNLAVHPWMIDSTMRNISLIDRLSKQRLSTVRARVCVCVRMCTMLCFCIIFQRTVFVRFLTADRS